MFHMQRACLYLTIYYSSSSCAKRLIVLVTAFHMIVNNLPVADSCIIIVHLLVGNCVVLGNNLAFSSLKSEESRQKINISFTRRNTTPLISHLDYLAFLVTNAIDLLNHVNCQDDRSFLIQHSVVQ